MGYIIPCSSRIRCLRLYDCRVFYCPPTKLWQGNVFIRVRMSFHNGERGRGSRVSITHYALDLTVQGSLPPASASGRYHRAPVQTCSLRPPPPPPTSTDI